MITQLLICSTVIWFIVGKFKWLWSGRKYSKDITPIVAGILATGCVFTYGLDIMETLGVSTMTTLVGQLLTILIIMTGSSGIETVISAVKDKHIK